MEKDPQDIACENPCGLHNIPRARVRETEREREKERGCVPLELLQYDWKHVTGERIDGAE